MPIPKNTKCHLSMQLSVPYSSHFLYFCFVTMQFYINLHTKLWTIFYLSSVAAPSFSNWQLLFAPSNSKWRRRCYGVQYRYCCTLSQISHTGQGSRSLDKTFLYFSPWMELTRPYCCFHRRIMTIWQPDGGFVSPDEWRYSISIDNYGNDVKWTWRRRWWPRAKVITKSLYRGNITRAAHNIVHLDFFCFLATFGGGRSAAWNLLQRDKSDKQRWHQLSLLSHKKLFLL